ncbi:MAG: hypothetical protein LUD12_01955 [Lachnospiraceae bacterium]|nr:hypothetical protein [Lachnospiraceae bacterium]
MRVETEILKSRSEQMQKDIRKLDGMINETELIRQKLVEEESLKTVSMILKLWSQGAKEIRETYQSYQRLTTAVADRYERCEKKVFQHVNEYTVRRYPPTVISVTILPVVIPSQFRLLKSEKAK